MYIRADPAHPISTIDHGTAPIDAKIHYSVKANSNLGILQLFKDLGAGFDIVSGGELSRVLAVGGDPKDVIFSGVGKSTAEIDLALKVGSAVLTSRVTAS